jgi:hypothetical protein
LLLTSRHEQQLREKEKSHTFFVQLEKGELIEVIFPDAQYQSPDFIAIFKKRLFEECGIYEECQYLKNADNTVDSLENIKLLEQKQLSSFDDSKIITFSVNKELQAKKMCERKLYLQAAQSTSKSIHVCFWECGSHDRWINLSIPDQSTVNSCIQEHLLLHFYCPIAAQYIFGFNKGRINERDVLEHDRLSVSIQDNHLSRCEWLKNQLEQAQKTNDLNPAVVTSDASRSAPTASASNASNASSTIHTASGSVNYKGLFHQAHQAQLKRE